MCFWLRLRLREILREVTETEKTKTNLRSVYLHEYFPEATSGQAEKYQHFCSIAALHMSRYDPVELRPIQ